MKKLLLLVFVVALSLGWTSAANAGGWATVTLDPLPATPAAGAELTVGFTILQHGQTPHTTSNAAIVIADRAGRTERFAARPEGAPGHHVATVRFPAAGVWRWEVEPDWFPKQSLGEITVAEAPIAASSSAVAAPVDLEDASSNTVAARQPWPTAARVGLAAALVAVLGMLAFEVVHHRRRYASA